MSGNIARVSLRGEPKMRAKQSILAIAVLVLTALLQLPAVAAPGAAAGRKHAAKANQLASQNRCKAAVAEFTKAYRLLKDPALLFNRAECYRKLGKDSQALKDYEKFLTEMPDAPNRSAIQERIASMRGGEKRGGEKAGKQGGRNASAGAKVADRWGDSSDTKSKGEEDSSMGTLGTSASAIGTAAPALPEPQPAADLTTQPVAPEPEQVGRSHTWIWIGTAVVVVGAGAFAAYHYWPRPKTDVPQTPLGNYAF